VNISGVVAPSVALHPVFSFAFAANSTVIARGPLAVDARVFTGFVESAQRPPPASARNLLAVPKCGEVLVLNGDDRIAEGGLAAHLLPQGGRFPSAEVRTWRGNGSSGGGGSCLRTATLSSSITATPMMTVSLTGSQSPSRELPPSTNLRNVPLSQQVKGAFVVGLGFVTGASGGAGLQVLHAQRAVALCGEAGDSSDEPLDIASSPLQLQIGSGTGRYARGAVLGNTAILAGWCAVTVGLMLLRKCDAAALMMPGLLYLPWGVLGVPILTSAVLCFLQANGNGGSNSGTSAGANVAMGLLGVVAALAPVAMLVHTAFFSFDARPYNVPLKRSRFPVVRQLLAWYGTTTEHEDLRPGFVEGWDFSGVLDFTKGKQWFVVVEPVLGLVTAVLAGVADLGGTGLCKGINVLQLLATGASLALLLLLRPHSVAADRVLALITASTQTVAALFGLLGRDIAFLAEPVQLVASGLHFAGYLASASVSGSARVLYFIKSAARERWQRQRQRRRLERLRSGEDRLTPGDLATLDLLAQVTRLPDAEGQAARADALKLLVNAVCRSTRELRSTTSPRRPTQQVQRGERGE
jgi:hypothetical protein